ncbi:MAG: glycoside hydrolase family 3 N-terminal domain-containing protein [Pseudomonadota bacterium]
MLTAIGLLRTRPRTVLVSALALSLLMPAFGPLPRAEEAEPLEGLLDRPADYRTLPLPRPATKRSITRECTPVDPQVAWNRLPYTLRDVSLREMIGQILVVSYSGTSPNARGVKVVRDALRRSEIGGVLTFRHNIDNADDTRAINEIFKNAHPVLPAMIAVDQEGGAVMRVKPSEGGPDTPSAQTIGRGSPGDAAAAYAAMADTLSDLGFTANFGPVVDLNVNPDNPVIARFGRSYGATAEKVLKYAEAFIEAHRARGIATSPKHFPGHGSSDDDSHDGAIDLTPTWSREELVPFAELIDRDLADMIMIGHLTLEGVTGPGELPASLSPIAIDGVLRSDLCFAGLVVTDDLAMDAVEARWGTPEATRLMLEAGGDIALVSLPAGKGMALVREITDHLVEHVETSPTLERRVREAYARVVSHKLNMSATVDERHYARAGETPAPQQPAPEQ